MTDNKTYDSEELKSRYIKNLAKTPSLPRSKNSVASSPVAATHLPPLPPSPSVVGASAHGAAAAATIGSSSRKVSEYVNDQREVVDNDGGYSDIQTEDIIQSEDENERQPMLLMPPSLSVKPAQKVSRASTGGTGEKISSSYKNSSGRRQPAPVSEMSKKIKKEPRGGFFRRASSSKAKASSHSVKKSSSKRAAPDPVSDDEPSSDADSVVSSDLSSSSDDGPSLFTSKKEKNKFLSKIMHRSKKRITKYGACFLTPILVWKFLASLI